MLTWYCMSLRHFGWLLGAGTNAWFPRYLPKIVAICVYMCASRLVYAGGWFAQTARFFLFLLDMYFPVDASTDNRGFFFLYPHEFVSVSVCVCVCVCLCVSVKGLVVLEARENILRKLPVWVCPRTIDVHECTTYVYVYVGVYVCVCM